MDKEIAKENLKVIIGKYNKFKDSDALKVEANAEKIIEEIFEKVLGWESLEDYVKRKSQETGKFPDYTFRIDGINKFFLEAKKLGADLDNLAFQKQAIGYARSSAVSFAILTNFKEIRVYVVDREIDNVKNYDKVQLFQPILIEKCLEDSEFEKLWLFSKDSFINKKIYSFAEEICKLPKRKEIDEQLSIKLNSMREKIKTNIKKNESKNKHIIVSNDNKIIIEEVVQKLLDRLVFIRVCEDREYENHHLESYVNAFEQNKNFSVLESVKALFRDYNIKNEKTGVGGYDSGLFEESLCDSIYLDDELLVKVIKEFYYFEDGTPIDFSKIPADILGNLYENYLSHISRNVETQKSHRKEQGIYYTPTYIVDYIVRNTLGEVLKDKKINIDKVKILDPSCGSGSFLIKAFDSINDYHKKREDYGQKRLAEDGTSYSTKERILRNNLFGVDLDAKAVEIAQLNLLLKIAEKGHKLPILQKNIKRGNSLIDDESITKLDYFKWDEKFSEIIQYDEKGNLKEGFGFDIIIGNPPYIFARSQKFGEDEKSYYYKKYKLQSYQINTYSLFVEKAYSLLKDNGFLGFIVPNNWLTLDTLSSFRKFILENCSDISIVNIYDKVFQEASVDTGIIIFRKGKPNNIQLYELKEGDIKNIGKFKALDFDINNGIINISSLKNKSDTNIMKGIEKNTFPLSQIAKVSTGLKAYQEGKGIPKQNKEIKESRKFHSMQKISKDYYPYLEGRDVNRYYLGWSGEYLKYGDFLAEPRKSVPFDGERILVRQIPSKPPYCINGAFVDSHVLHDINSMVIFENSKQYPLKLILGIINSKLISYWFFNKFGKLQRGLFPQFKVKELKIFPIIKNINDSTSKEIVKLVDEAILYNKKLKESKGKEDEKDFKDKLEYLYKKIDDIVYDLYGITDKEKEIIEESLK